MQMDDFTSRVWYGRMYLPPSNAIVMPENVTYGDIRSEQIKSNHLGNLSSMSLGCSTSLVSAELGGSCPSKEDIFCWFQCMPTKSCSESTSNAKCVNSHMQVWAPLYGHCTDCTIQCVEESPDNTTNSFCNGFGTSMYMEGFVTIDATKACVILLFQQLELNTPVKFALGSVATFLFGIFVEYLLHLRRHFEHNLVDNGRKTGQRLFLYGIQVIAGYLLMLLVMTYSVFIFLSSVLGLVLGHYWFNMKIPVPPEVSDPCCDFMIRDDESGVDIQTPLMHRASIESN